MKSLREHRRTQLLSVRALAERAGVSTKTIVEAEKGRKVERGTSLRTMRLLSDALGVPAMDITEFAATISNDYQENDS